MINKISRSNYKYIKIICLFIILLVLIFALLRCTHIVVKIGKTYKWGSSSELLINSDHNLNNKTVNEIVYMKGLKSLSLSDTEVTKADFLTEYNDLEYLNIVCPADFPIKGLPSLHNSPNLEYVSLVNVEIESLDIFSELENIEMLTVAPINTKIYDITGIKNLQRLRYLSVTGLECEDTSILFEFPDLTYLKINEGVLTESEIKALEEKGVEVREQDYSEEE